MQGQAVAYIEIRPHEQPAAQPPVRAVRESTEPKAAPDLRCATAALARRRSETGAQVGSSGERAASGQTAKLGRRGGVDDVDLAGAREAGFAGKDTGGGDGCHEGEGKR